MLFTAGTRVVNAMRTLEYWQAHQAMTIFEHCQGRHGYAVVEESQTRCFGPSWRQTSPEELTQQIEDDARIASYRILYDREKEEAR